MGVFRFFCRPLTLGECYTGQPACSIRPANHALAYICLYPCPLPFRKAPLRVALFKRNHRLLRFWAVNCWAHTLLTACLIHHLSVCILIVCAGTNFSPWYSPKEDWFHWWMCPEHRSHINLNFWTANSELLKTISLFSVAQRFSFQVTFVKKSQYTRHDF